MQGIFVNHVRCATKKALREAVAAKPAAVSLEATSVFGNEYDGPLDLAPDGTYTVVGPDPYTSRRWYANIKKTGDSLVVS
jgi:hypothetical protein